MNETEKIAIRPNLHHALHRIRLQSQCVRLWVDQICINQVDEKERNLQVQRMGDIFQKAQNVWIWLGEQHSSSNEAIDLIPHIMRTDLHWEESWVHQHNFQALNSLLGRPWFQRGWVIQEAALSKNCVLLCGSRHVGWREFTESVILIQDRIESELAKSGSTVLHAQLRVLFNNFQGSPATRLLNIVTTVYQTRMDGGTTASLPLEALVEIGTHFETTDSRDSIYALINLANDVSLRAQPEIFGSIKPDYRKSTRDVFADLVMHCCHVSGSLDIICRPWAPRGDFQGIQVLQEDLPSWIRTRDQLPFGDPTKRSSYRVQSNSLVEHSQSRYYNAHFSTTPQVEMKKRPDGNLALVARGIAIADVSLLSLRMAGAVIPKTCLNILRSVCGQGGGEAAVLCADLLKRRDKSNSDIDSKIPGWLIKQVPALIYDPWHESAGLDVEEALDRESRPDIREYLELVRQCVWNRRTFKGHRSDGVAGSMVGLLPQAAKIGDTIGTLYGCSVPVVLRKLQHNDGSWHWRLIGEAYVHRFMDGQAKEGSFKEVDFEIR